MNPVPAGAVARPLWPAIAAGWLLGVVMLTLVHWSDIAGLRFYDPDDAMRLLEVRDWLAGQSWWDVSQHRLGGGVPFAMHWSRLVDLPIAGTILALNPLVGEHAATLAAMTIVPLVTLGCIIAIIAHIARRLLDHEHAAIAALLVPIAAPIVAQAEPMRIDHHGWQITLALAATLALISRPTPRNGALAGLAVAALLTTSFEGLPIAAALCGAAALGWAFVPERRGQVLAMMATLVGSAVLFQIATRGPGFWTPACDAMAPPWLGVLGVGAVGVTIATAARARTLAMRLAMLGGAGAATVATFLILAPDCLSGPFGMLDPFVRQMWFANISEGLPVWHQKAVPIVMTFGTPLLGLIGSWLALRDAEGERRAAWWTVAGLLSVATLLALMVLRAGGTATALAIPGAAVVVVALLKRARAISRPVPRLAATAATFALAAPSLVLPVSSALWPSGDAIAAVPVAAARAQCGEHPDFTALAALPPSRLFAPLDIGPEILVRTRHEAVASGYHRNNARIHLVMAAFTGGAEAARRAVAETGADYVIGCPGLKETELYDRVAPKGFWARLERGERFDWLAPVALAGSPILVWRVNDPSHRAKRLLP